MVKPAEIVIGERFGELVVTGRAASRADRTPTGRIRGGAVVDIKCDCGVEMTARLAALRNGMKSCGRKSHFDAGIIEVGESMIGRRFGTLVVVAATAQRDSNAQVIVRCDCGVERPAKINWLVRGSIASCGGDAHKEIVPVKRWRWSGTPKTYVIQAVGIDRVKIGSARNIEERMRDLQTGCPVELRLIAMNDNDIESEIHDTLDGHRVHGEWFHANEHVMAVVAARFSPASMTVLSSMSHMGRRKAKQFRCKRCGEMGHMAKTCIRPLAAQTQPASDASSSNCATSSTAS